MGRGRKGVVDQGNKKIKQACGILPKEDGEVFLFGLRNSVNQNIVLLPEEVLNQLKKMNPRDVANILVNS